MKDECRGTCIIPVTLKHVADVFLVSAWFAGLLAATLLPAALFVHWAVQLLIIGACVSVTCFSVCRLLRTGNVVGYWLAIAVSCVPFVSLVCVAYSELTGQDPVSVGSFIIPASASILGALNLVYLLSLSARRWATTTERLRDTD